MTDKLFDEFVKSKLEQYDSGAPMHVWERMKKDKDDDPKGFFFWRNRYLLLIGALFLATGIGYLLMQRDSNNHPSAAATGAGNSNAIESQNRTQITTTTTNNSTGDKTNSAGTPASSSATDIRSESNTDTGMSANNPAVSHQQLTASAAQSVKLKNNLSGSKNDVNNTNPSGTIFKQSRNKKAVQQVKNKLAGTGNSNLISAVNGNTSVNNSSLASNQPYSISLSGFQPKPYLPPFKLGNIAMPDSKPSCPTITGPRRRDFYIEAYLSPDYNVRSLSVSNAPSGYLTERNNTEGYRTSYSAGVRAVKNIGEKTLIKAGINYSQINERLRMVTENSKQLTQIITIRTVIRSPGDTLFVRDTMYFEQTGTRYRTTYNRYRFIDLPLIFSYEFGNPDLIHFAVNAGPVFNITSFYGGEVLDTSYKPLRISTSSGTGVNNWRSNIGIGLFASVAMYKKLNDHIDLFAEPYMRYNFNPVTQSNNFIKQRYIITGMQLGIRFNLIPPGHRYR
ncbi:MAG: hypothetical protein K2X48_12055 [Chitinophagaceae bacterium]|nr:hypothetical protein [Chitinophagaceae bacterium]